MFIKQTNHQVLEAIIYTKCVVFLSSCSTWSAGADNAHKWAGWIGAAAACAGGPMCWKDKEAGWPAVVAGESGRNDVVCELVQKGKERRRDLQI